MKKKGSVFPFASKRKTELYNAVKSVLTSEVCNSMEEVFKKAVRRPCSRYWVTDERAAIALSEMDRGCFKCSCRIKRRMYRHLYISFCKLRKKSPNLSFAMLAHIAVNAPAPEFFISPARARFILRKEFKY